MRLHRTMIWILCAVLIASAASALGQEAFDRDLPCITKRGSEYQRLRALSDERLDRAPRPIDVQSYDLSLTVNDSNAKMSGSVTLQFVPLQDLQKLTLDFQIALAPNEGMLTDAVWINGSASTFVHEGDSLIIDLPTTMTPNDVVNATVDFHGDPVRGYSVGFGLARRYYRKVDGSVDWDRPMLATLSEPVSARFWWPCNDHPSDAATVRLTVTGPAAWTLAAPGVRESDVLISPTQRQQTFFMAREIPSYLVSLVLSELEMWTDTVTATELLSDGSEVSTSVPLEYYAPTTLRPACENSWSNTKAMIGVFETLFGPYPYADIKYGMALFSFGGAMEHPTLSSMGDGTVGSGTSRLFPGPTGESIVAHELAHQWFGDALRVAAWTDIWLNEGFARYCEVVWLEEFYGMEYGRIWLDRIRFDSYQGTIREPDALFSGTTYNKGAWVLHMLRQVMGRDEMHSAMRNYMVDSSLRFNSVKTEDFQAHCEAVYGASLAWFFDPWLNQQGRPRIDFSWSETAGGAVLRFQQPADRVYRLPLPVRLVHVDGSSEDRTIWISDTGEANTELQISSAEPVADILIDADRNWLLDVNVNAPTSVRLLGVRPNPFNPATTVSFVVREESDVVVSIFDMRGRRVRELVNGFHTPNVYSEDWDGSDSMGKTVAAGVYVVRVEGPDSVETRKISLVK